METNGLGARLTEGNVFRQLVRFSLPFVLANLLQTLYSLVDMVVVGQFVGSAGLSGVSVAGNLTMMMTNLGIGFASGGQILVSQIVGSGDTGRLKYAVGTSGTLVVSLGAIVAVVGVTLAGPLLNLLDTPVEAMDEARSYLIICSAGMVFIFGYNYICTILRGMGDSVRPMIFVAVATAVNLALDLVFVAVLDMGSAGAALATVMAQALSFFVAVVYLFRHRTRFVPDFQMRCFIPDARSARIIFRLGLPLALQNAAISISMLLVTWLVNGYGLIASAATGVGTRLYGLMGVVTNSLMTAGSAMIGQNVGAGKPDRIREIVRKSMVIALIFFVFVAAVSLLFPVQIFSLFNQEPEVLAYAPEYMRISVLTYLSFAIMSPLLALVIGVGFTSYNLLISLMDGVVTRIGLCLLLSRTFGMGLQGVWLGTALAGYVTVIMAGAYYLSGRWRRRTAL